MASLYWICLLLGGGAALLQLTAQVAGTDQDAPKEAVTQTEGTMQKSEKEKKEEGQGRRKQQTADTNANAGAKKEGR